MIHPSAAARTAVQARTAHRLATLNPKHSTIIPITQIIPRFAESTQATSTIPFHDGASIDTDRVSSVVTAYHRELRTRSARSLIKDSLYLNKEASMTARSLGLLYVLRPPLLAAAALLLTLAGSPTPGSQPKNGTRAGGEILGNGGAAADHTSVHLSVGATPTFAWPASVSAGNRRFLDQKGHVYLLKTISSWAMAQNCTNDEITSALEGLKALGFNAVTVSPFGVHMNDSFGEGPAEPGAARTQLFDVHPRWRRDQLWSRKMVAVWRHRSF